MRFCIPIPCFFGDLDFCDAIRKVASLGFDAAETYRWKALTLTRCVGPAKRPAWSFSACARRSST